MPIGIQGFESLRHDGYAYVDKTRFVHQLVNTGKMLKNFPEEIQVLAEAPAEVINSVDMASTNPISVIYQSGYLTIKGYDKEFETYLLGFPNREVEQGFIKFLVPWYTQREERRTAFNIRNFVKDVQEGRTEDFLQRLRSLFADTPYELIRDLENHYQNVVWLLFKLMGFYVKAEYHTSAGRIDLMLQTKKYCYVMEFKLDGSAEEALAQISDKAYAIPFEMNGQQIIRIGINFDMQTRNIERCLIG